MTKWLYAILASAVLLVAPFALFPTQRAVAGTHAVAAAQFVQLFDTEAGAQKHCPSDTVVWLNLPSGVYHMKGERWYGRTKHGAYVCKTEADAAGDRETLNGQ
jgi:hypothetical protein